MAVLLLSFVLVPDQAAAERRFTVRDSIELVRFSEPSGREPDAAVTFSPDGQRFFVVTTRGLIESNEVESILWIFDARAVRGWLGEALTIARPRPRAVARHRSVPRARAFNSYASVISRVRWSSDSRRLLFLAEDSGVNRVHSVDLEEGRQSALTPEGWDVSQFEGDADGLLYAVRRRVAASPNGGPPGMAVNSSALAVTGRALRDILLPASTTDTEPFRLRYAHRGRDRSVERGSLPLELPHIPFLASAALSPDGRSAIVLQPATQITERWEQYEPSLPHLRFRSTESRPLQILQYALVDLEDGTVAPIIDAPNAFAAGYADENRAVWSPSGRSALLLNTFLPLDRQRTRSRQMPCAAAIVLMRTREVRCIVPTRFDRQDPLRTILTDASFGATDDEVRLTFNRQRRSYVETYARRSGQWILAAQNETQDSTSISVTIRQDLNTSPALWARTPDGRGAELWNPNPGLRDLALGEASIERWSDDGYTSTAILLKPPGYQPGNRYPLVIQIYSVREQEFLTDGSYTTAFAARPLAAAGIVVLQMAGRRENEVTAREASDNVTALESAVRHLNRQGLIDPSRVGVIGFSRTAYYVESTLVARPNLFAAATIADGVDYSYLQYLMFSENIQTESETIYGSPPFAEGLRGWMSASPGFRLNNVRTPLRIEAITPASVLAEWEIYASLRLQGKPVDLIYFPNGQHILQAPLERLASQGGNVDWFRFWLQDYEDPDPAKAEQYVRWRQMRDKAAAHRASAHDASIAAESPIK